MNVECFISNVSKYFRVNTGNMLFNGFATNPDT